MDILNETREVWYERLLGQRTEAIADELVGRQLHKVADEVGPYAVLRTLDAAHGLETPEPTIEFLAGYSMFLYYSRLTSGKI